MYPDKKCHNPAQFRQEAERLLQLRYQEQKAPLEENIKAEIHQMRLATRYPSLYACTTWELTLEIDRVKRGES